MTIPCPAPQWPASLLEVGPEQDRSILLRGSADIAGVPHAVLAIRIDPIRMAADLRGELPAHVYGSSQAQDIVDLVSLYTEITDRSLVRLATGAYVVVMIPAGSDA